MNIPENKKSTLSGDENFLLPIIPIMGKRLIINEKPSVSQSFAAALKVNGKRNDGYIEDGSTIITWCVGHLVTMSYPEAYDAKYKKWNLNDLPFIPQEYKYEVINNVRKQFHVVKQLLNRKDVDTIYYAGDSGREGLLIQGYVRQMAGHNPSAKELVVWIDSQTEEEIVNGVRDAKPFSFYANKLDSGYLRGIEDYLMGINFSRVLTLKYGQKVQKITKKEKWTPVSVGRVMTCVLAMVVDRELEIKHFKPTSYYGIRAENEIGSLDWKVTKDSKYFQSPLLYNDSGFLKQEDANNLIAGLNPSGKIESITKKQEKKNAPLLFNLAELQNECSSLLKLSPDETLQIAQELYEKKLTTYPRTDARVLTTAMAKTIRGHIQGLCGYAPLSSICKHIADNGLDKTLPKTKYVNDAAVTDHYAIIPTGKNINAINELSKTSRFVYDLIARRFLAIFLPPAVYSKLQLIVENNGEHFFLNTKILASAGFLGLYPNKIKENNMNLFQSVTQLKKGSDFPFDQVNIKTGTTKPPSRYNSGSMILAMENAGQLIEDEELREMIKGCGIGTSATRAETLKKLVRNDYINLNKKTQILTPTKTGYVIYAVVKESMPQLLSPRLTASWEKGLDGVDTGTIKKEEYLNKLYAFVISKTNAAKTSGTSGLETTLRKMGI